MTKEEVIIKSRKYMESLVNKPDAGGNYYCYPIQYFFEITRGYIDLISSVRYKSNLEIDRTYPHMRLKEGVGNHRGSTNRRFSVSIKEPRGFTKTTGVDFKSMFINTPEGQDGDRYKGEFIYYFSSFDEANKFYLAMADRLNLGDFTYLNKRYTQHLEDNAPEWSKEEYYKLIRSDVE